MQPEGSLKRKSSPWSDFRKNIQKVFVCSRECSSSANSTWDNDMILFFEAFLRTPIFLDREWTYYVTPKTWALAFLQSDLVDVTVTLCEVIFTQDERVARDQEDCGSLMDDEDRLERLDIKKRNAVQYAAFWMKNKQQDPWSYEPKETPPVIPEKDIVKINMGFLKFNKTISPGQMMFENWLKPDKDDREFERGYFLGRQETPFDKEFNTKLHESLQRVLSIELDYSCLNSREEIFKTVVGLYLKKQKVALNLLELPGVTDSSKAVQYLTTMAIADSDEFTDVFFDPVQVSKTHLHVLERRRNIGIAEMTRSLFRMVFRRYNQNQDPQSAGNDFESLDTHESASVLLLSVIRGVKKLQGLCPEEDTLCDFMEESIQEFEATNFFPSRQEMEDIFTTLRSALGSTKLGTIDPRNTRSDETLCNRFKSTLSIHSPMPGPIEMIDFSDVPSESLQPTKLLNYETQVIQCVVKDGERNIILDSHPLVLFPVWLLCKASDATLRSSARIHPADDSESDSGDSRDKEMGRQLLFYLFTTEELSIGTLTSSASRRKFSIGKFIQRYQRKGFFTDPGFREKSHALIKMVKVVKALRREDPALSQIKNLAEGMKLQFVIETSADDNILRESIFTNFSISSYLKSKEYDKQKVKE